MVYMPTFGYIDVNVTIYIYGYMAYMDPMGYIILYVGYWFHHDPRRPALERCRQDSCSLAIFFGFGAGSSWRKHVAKL